MSGCVHWRRQADYQQAIPPPVKIQVEERFKGDFPVQDSLGGWEFDYVGFGLERKHHSIALGIETRFIREEQFGWMGVFRRERYVEYGG